jgi:hypothetical protein
MVLDDGRSVAWRPESVQPAPWRGGAAGLPLTGIGLMSGQWKVWTMHPTRPETVTAEPASAVPRLIGAAVGGAVTAMLAGTVALWLHYGTAVFHDMILSGISACF